MRDEREDPGRRGGEGEDDRDDRREMEGDAVGAVEGSSRSMLKGSSGESEAAAIQSISRVFADWAWMLTSTTDELVPRRYT